MMGLTKKLHDLINTSQRQGAVQIRRVGQKFECKEIWGVGRFQCTVYGGGTLSAHDFQFCTAPLPLPKIITAPLSSHRG